MGISVQRSRVEDSLERRQIGAELLKPLLKAKLY